MRRCKKCGNVEGGSSECLTIEVTGPVVGRHEWQSFTEDRGTSAPGPEYWMSLNSATNESTPTNYLTADTRHSPGMLLDSRRSNKGNPMLAQRPTPSRPLIAAEVRRAMGSTPARNWHQYIIQECAPICRKLPKVLHPTLPFKVC